jgi:RNA polymerase sigma-70 factor, ECF subfamily
MATAYRQFQPDARPALLRGARAGDRESLAKLILPYSSGMYLGALRMTGNHADAEDVRQESFLKVVSRLEQFTGTQEGERDELCAWVSRIASNASIDVIRKRREGRLFSLEQPTGNGETLGSGVAAPENNPEERLARREVRKLMADAIAQLAPDLRQVCLLRDVLQYSTQEVADRLGISAMAVRLRLFRAHRRLRERLTFALQPRKKTALPTAVTRTRARAPEGKSEPAMPFAPCAEFACGD